MTDVLKPSTDLNEPERQKLFAIAEAAYAQVMKWLRMSVIGFGSAAGVLAFTLTILGVKGYSDWTATVSGLSDSLDAKVHSQVEENLRLHFKDRTEDVIKLSISARTEMNASMREVGDLSKRSATLDGELSRLSQKLKQLEEEADRKAAEYTEKLNAAADQLTPSAVGQQRAKERQFLEKTNAFASKLKVTLPAPRIVFGVPGRPTNVAMYDTQRSVYIVNPGWIDFDWLPAHAALMGRFFEKNRAIIDHLGEPKYPETAFWEDFRQSTVNYILLKEGIEQGGFAVDAGGHNIHRLLIAMESKSRADAVKKLAIALLEQFDRDWSRANFQQRVIAVNEKVQALSSQTLSEVFRAAQY